MTYTRSLLGGKLEIAFVGAAKATGLRSRRSTSRGLKRSALDISSIPGPESPPVVVYGDSPARYPIHPEDVKRKGLEEVVRSGVAEKVLPSTLPWVIFHERMEGVEIDVESSEATPL
ncbi:hypothetical protein Hanom_Chr12g01110441 [Helianthus anomalus]